MNAEERAQIRINRETRIRGGAATGGFITGIVLGFTLGAIVVSIISQGV